jgi:hypothetical protein
LNKEEKEAGLIRIENLKNEIEKKQFSNEFLLRESYIRGLSKIRRID